MTYLIIHFLEDKLSFDFNNELEATIKRKAADHDVIMSMDNFSDAVTTQAALRLIKESDQLMVICDVATEEVDLGAGLSLLNALAKKQNVRLLTNRIHPKLAPVFKRLKGEVYEGDLIF